MREQRTKSAAGRRPLLVAAGLSLMCHAVVVTVAASHGIPSPRPQMTRDAVEVVPISPRDPIRATQKQVREPEPPLPEPSSHPQRRLNQPLLASVTPRVQAGPLVAPHPVKIEPTIEPLPPSTDAPADEPIVDPLILSPREAALRYLSKERPRPMNDKQAMEERLNASLSGLLPGLPNDKSPMPDLRPDGDGNLVYEHRGLTAKIGPDGNVDFDFGYGAAVEGFGLDEDPALADATRIPGVPMVSFKGKNCPGGPPPQDTAGLGMGLRPHADLNDLLLMAAGDDPHAAQKRWFLRQTEQIRDELAAKNRQKSMAKAPVAARRRVSGIWNDASLTASAKRRLIFALWDECEEPASADDVRPEAKAGLKARQIIEAFVRKNLPPDSDDAFSPQQIEGLNAKRVSKVPFRPYR